MIQINPQYATAYVKKLVESQVQTAIEWGDTIDIDGDVDYLHDISIESADICQTDRVYDALYSLLPVIIDEVEDYINDLHDVYDEEVWSYAMREGIGLCD